jgi:hypothetical protein
VNAKSQPGIEFNAVEPGTTAEVVVRLATLGPDGPSGTLQDEFGELSW